MAIKLSKDQNMYVFYEFRNADPFVVLLDLSVHLVG